MTEPLSPLEAALVQALREIAARRAAEQERRAMLRVVKRKEKAA